MKGHNVRGSERFFQSSPSARSHPRFLSANRFLPPLALEAVVEAIKALMREGLPVELYFANGEGDPYAVELAGKLNGYVIGMDSDFVILNADGYKGYIPLDDLLWDTSTPGGRWEKSSGIKQGIIPPMADLAQISFACSVTSPTVLASHLQLPVSLLPLLGALIGNHDFSPSPQTRFGKRSLFFEKGVFSWQRITRVSTAIRDATPNPQNSNTPGGCDGVVDLTRRVVRALLLEDVSSLAPDEESKIIEHITESIRLYDIPLREDGALRPPGLSCLLGDPGDAYLYGRDIGKIVRQGYLDRYRSGNINPEVLNPLHTGTMWVRPFLEDPQKETAQRTIGRPIREWIYAIIDDGTGLPARLGKEGGGGVSKEKVVAEYIRRGSHFGPEDLRVRNLQELLEEVKIPLKEPVQLAPESTRLRLFLAIIGAETVAEKLGNISPEQILPILAVRWVVSWLYSRTMEVEGSADRFAEKWTKSEVKALLLAFIRPTASRAAPEIQERHIQLTAQVLVSIQTIIFLGQVLLLDFNRSMPLNLVTHLSGRRFHQLLNDGHDEISSSEVLDPLMDVVTAGLNAEAFGDEAFDKPREGGGHGGSRGRGRGGVYRRGMFNAPAGV